MWESVNAHFNCIIDWVWTLRFISCCIILQISSSPLYKLVWIMQIQPANTQKLGPNHNYIHSQSGRVGTRHNSLLTSFKQLLIFDWLFKVLGNSLICDSIKQNQFILWYIIASFWKLLFCHVNNSVQLNLYYMDMRFSVSESPPYPLYDQI